MLLRLFKGTHPSLLIFIPLFAGLVWSRSLLNISPSSWQYELNPMPLYELLLKINIHPLLYKLCGLLILILHGFYLARFNTKFILVKARTNLPALLFIIISSSYIPIQELHPVLFAGLLILIATDFLFVSYKKEILSYKPFEASLLISLASLFYAKAAFYLLIVWIGLAYLRPFLWREWVFTLIGFLLPYLFLFSYYYLWDYNLTERYQAILENFTFVHEYDYLSYPYFIFYGFLLFLVLLASFTMIRAFQGLKVYVRRFFRFFFWMFILTVVLYFIMFTKSMELLPILAIPVSMILTFYFFSLKDNVVGEILFTILIGLLVFLIFIH